MNRKYVRNDIRVQRCVVLCSGSYQNGLDFIFDVDDSRIGGRWENVKIHLEDGTWTPPNFNQPAGVDQPGIRFCQPAHQELQDAVIEQLSELSRALWKACEIEVAFGRERSAPDRPSVEGGSLAA
jgi:hypothetical protein